MPINAHILHKQQIPMHVLPNANQGPSSIKYSSIVADKEGDAQLANNSQKNIYLNSRQFFEFNKGQRAPSDLVVPGKKNL